MANEFKSYHLQFSKFPSEIWPNGVWALYRINGDQIAQRIGFDENGKVNRRDSWCGYIGSYETLAEVTTAIENDKTE